MSRRATDVLLLDADLTALAERRPAVSSDPVLAMLSGWAAALDAQPMIGTPAETRQPGPQRSRSVRVVALTVALTLSSSGVAAAVKGDPFAPLHYVVDRIQTFGQGDEPGHGVPGIPELGVLEPGAGREPATERAKQSDEQRASRGDRHTSSVPAPTGAGGGVVANRDQDSSGSRDARPERTRPTRVIEVRGGADRHPGPTPSPTDEPEPTPPPPSPEGGGMGTPKPPTTDPPSPDATRHPQV